MRTMGKMRNASRWALIITCVYIVVSFVFAFCGEFLGLDKVLFEYILPPLIGLALPVLIVVVAFHKEAFGILPFRRFRLADAFLIIGMTVFSRPIIGFISWAGSLVFPPLVGESIVGLIDERGFLVGLLAVAVMPAICEEIVARGVFQYGYKYQPWWKACLMVALFFAMLHLNMQQFLYVFPLGFLFAFYVRSTGSLFAGVLAHFINNAIDVSAVSLQNYLEWFTNGSAEIEAALDPAAMDAAALAGSIVVYALFTGLFVLLLVIFVKRNKEKLTAKPVEEAAEEAVEEPVEGAAPPVKDRAFTVPFFIMIGIFVIMSALMMLAPYLQEFAKSINASGL